MSLVAARLGFRAVVGLVALTAALFVATDPIVAQEKQLGAADGWVKLPGPGETRAMAFASFDNPTMYEIYLKSASADVAGNAEFRDAGLSADAALKPLEFVPVPAYESIYMGPKGVHILLMDLKRPLKEGDTVTLTVTTDGATLQIPAIVKKD